MTALNHCESCGLEFEYPANLHQCRKGPRIMAGSWMDEIRELQQVDWREDRKGKRAR